MDFLRQAGDWLGLNASLEERNNAARRNMLIVALGSVLAVLFASMLSFCLLTGAPCPVDGFDDAVNESSVTHMRFSIFCPTIAVAFLLLGAYAIRYLRRDLCHTLVARLVAMLFSLFLVMLWGVAESGQSASDQVLIFASIQFLVSGLIIFSPLVSIVYFIGTFVLFGVSLDLAGLMQEKDAGHLTYLATLDTIVNWIVYGLHQRGVVREMQIADMSRRDELTGAKNRHYLRDDFPRYTGFEVFVMLCDVDDFKRYNDGYSHDVGDALLRDFYFALREAFGDECTYRYGGDEFLVVTNEFGEEEFQAKSRKVSQQLKLVTVEGEDAHLTFSGGYVHGCPAGEADFRNMLHEADEQLMEAKRAGKNRVVGGPYDR